MYKFRALIVIMLAAALTSCYSNMNFNYPAPSPTAEGMVIGAVSGAAIGAISTTSGAIPAGVVVGGVLGAAIGHEFERHATLAQKLRRQGIQVILIGDKIDVILPADKVFYPYSAHMNSNFYPILDQVAEYIRQYTKTLVKVSAHTDNTACCERALSLTREQAQAVASYLWEQDIDARLIYSVGYGCNCPIAFNQVEKGRATNRRIEIQFWRIPKPNPL